MLRVSSIGKQDGKLACYDSVSIIINENLIIILNSFVFNPVISDYKPSQNMRLGHNYVPITNAMATVGSNKISTAVSAAFIF